MSRRIWRILAVVAGYLVCFVVLDKASAVFRSAAGITLWYPPPALSLLLLLAGGARYAPVLVAGTFLAGLLTPTPLHPPALLLVALIIAVGYGLAASVLQRHVHLDVRFRRLHDVAWFILVTLSAAAGVAVLAVTVYAATGVLSWGNYPRSVLDWWIGDTNGIVILAPFLLVHGADPLRSWLRGAAGGPRHPIQWPAPRLLGEIAVQALGTFFFLWLVFGIPQVAGFHLFYLLFVPLVWIGLRLGLPGMTAGVLALNCGVLVGMRGINFPPAMLADLQLFMLVLSLTGLLLGAGMTERHVAEVALRANEQRTRALFAAARWQAQELALLDQVRTALTQELNLALIFRRVVEAIAQTFGYTQVSLYLLKSGELQLQHEVGYDQVLERIPVPRGVMGHVALTGRPVLLEDVRTNPAFIGAIPGIISEVCVPLLDQDRVVGVLNVESTGGSILGVADLRLMMALSEHVGSAIARARLYSAVRASEQQYRSVVETVQEVIFQTDEVGCWTLLNPAWTEITGFTRQESLLTPLVAYVHPEDRQRTARAFQLLFAGTAAKCRLEIRYRTKTGGPRWLEVHARALAFRGGPPAGTAGTLTDITERKQAETALRRQNEELAALHETTIGLIAQLDPATLLGFILARAAALLRTPDGYLYVLESDRPEIVVRVSAGIFAPQIGYRLQRGEGLAGRVWEQNQPLAIADYNTWSGHRPELERLAIRALVGVPLRSGAQVVGILGLAYSEAGRVFTPDDIALLDRFAQLASLALKNAQLYAAAQKELQERTRAQQTLAYLALHDPLTDLPNRLMLHDRLQLAIRIAERRNQTSALLVMDLDRFKEVNDTLGHDLGDLLLRQVGSRLRTTLRASDTVARLGGDEFAVVVPAIEDWAAGHIAHKLLRALEQPFEVEGHSLDVRVSIGIALYPEHGRDVETLMRRADVAMYQAKRHDSGYTFYSAEQDPYSPRRLSLIGDLRRAIARDELVLYYQPKVSHRTGCPTGAEALIRWPHPEHGLLGPDVFLPLAEHTGLIGALSAWVLNTALHQCRAWTDMGIRLPVAVNLSMRDLHDPRLPETITTLLETWGIGAGLLRVEITEGAAMADPGRTLGVLTRLRDIGVQMSIDDFGTGHSSLAQLKRLPVNQIKIDKSFVREMAKNENDAVIVRSTIELGHNLGLSVVAEGVEDAATWEALTQWGCDESQGFFLSRAIPAADLIRWLAARRAC